MKIFSFYATTQVQVTRHNLARRSRAINYSSVIGATSECRVIIFIIVIIITITIVIIIIITIASPRQDRKSNIF